MRAQAAQIIPRYMASQCLVGLFFVLVLGVAGTTNAATFTVTKTADTKDGACNADCSLREAIDAANGAGAGPHTINIPAGTYTISGAGDDTNTVGDFDISVEINFVGAGSNLTILDGNLADRILQVKTAATPISVTGIKFTRARAGANNGGGIYSLSGNITVTDSIFDDCDGAQGGALWTNNASTITISGSTFTNSNTTGAGGAVNGGTVAITSSSFTSNAGGGTPGGGAIYASGAAGTLTVTGTSSFSGNSSTGYGGAIYAANTATITGATFDSNHADTANQRGGAVHVTGLGQFTNCTVTNNTTAGQGGGINGGGAIEINNSTISGNTATAGHGGGVYAQTTLTITATTTIDSNTAGAAGGGVHSVGAADITGATVSNNHSTTGSATTRGGGIYAGGNLTLGSSSVTGNWTFGGGGGIAGGGTVAISTSTISGNQTTGSTGGGIYAQSTSTITDSTVAGNSASSNGGGIVANGDTTVTRSTFSGNSGNSGGGIYRATGNVYFYNSTLSANTSTATGGGIYTQHGTITNSTIYGNSATNAGTAGGVYEYGTCTYTNTITASNTGNGAAANCGGGTKVSNGYNIESANTCAFAGTGDQPNTNPLLNALASNGGPTQTHALQSTSPAIDKADNTTCAAAPINNVDQRGQARPIDGDAVPGAVCDIGAYEYVPNINTAPVGGYTADNVIPTAQVVQSTDGLGIMTITWKGRDNESNTVTLKTFQYSVDGGATWNAPTNADASAALSANWTNNGGGGWSTATTLAAATAHSFTFNTKHADVAGLNGVDQADVQVRCLLNDGTVDSTAPVTSQNFQVDDLTPTATITSATYNAATDTMVITGTNFDTIAATSTDIKGYVDWTKFVWDINGDDGATANITFALGDITSLTVTDATTLTLVFSGVKGTAIESTTGYGATGGADTIDVTAGFSRDAFGNASASDAVANAPLGATVSGTVYTDEGSTPIANGTTIRLLVNGASAGTATTTGGAYAITTLLSAGDALLVYIDSNGGTVGNTVTVASGANLSGLDIYANRLITRHDNAGSLTNALMGTALGAYSDTDILYAVTGGNLTANGANTELFAWPGHTFAPGGTITTTHMDINGTLTAAANAINVAGNWDATGGVFTSTGTVTFNATSGTVTIIPGGVDVDHDFQNVVFNDAAGTATFQLGGAIDVDGDFTVTDGIFDTTATNYAVTVAGNLTDSANSRFKANASTITVGGDVSLNANNDATESADWNNATLVLNGAASNINYNGLASWWANGFNNLTVGQGGVTDTLNNWLTVKGTLTIGTGGLTSPATTTLALTKAGDALSFNATSTLSIDTLMFLKYGGGQNLPTLNNGYSCNISIAGGSSLVVSQTGNVTVNSGKNLLLTGDNNASRALSLNTGGFALTVGGNLVIGAGGDTGTKELVANGSTITVGGNFTVNSGSNTFTPGTSTVVLNGTGQAITGTTTFNNLTKSVTSADTLTFQAGATTTINGVVTLTGASGQLLTLASSTGSSAWNFVVNSGATKAISYVGVSWSDASGSHASQKPIAPTNSTNGGHTTDWFAAASPSITVVKSSTLISDPVNETTNPLHIPGAIISYQVQTTNSGGGSPDIDTVVVTDVLDATLEYDVTTGVIFTANTSGLTLGTVSYSHVATPTTYTYTPTGPYDPNVAGIKVTTTGTFASGGANFTLSFRVRVK